MNARRILRVALGMTLAGIVGYWWSAGALVVNTPSCGSATPPGFCSRYYAIATVALVMTVIGVVACVGSAGVLLARRWRALPDARRTGPSGHAANERR